MTLASGGVVPEGIRASQQSRRTCTGRDNSEPSTFETVNRTAPLKGRPCAAISSARWSKLRACPRHAYGVRKCGCEYIPVAMLRTPLGLRLCVFVCACATASGKRRQSERIKKKTFPGVCTPASITDFFFLFFASRISLCTRLHGDTYNGTFLRSLRQAVNTAC